MARELISPATPSPTSRPASNLYASTTCFISFPATSQYGPTAARGRVPDVQPRSLAWLGVLGAQGCYCCWPALACSWRDYA